MPPDLTSRSASSVINKDEVVELRVYVEVLAVRALPPEKLEGSRAVYQRLLPH